MKTADVNRIISNLEDELADTLAKEMQQEIDREIFWKMLLEIGWTRVMLDRLQDNKHAIDITHWLAENCQHPFERSGRDFIFENEQDATLFILRWV